MASRKLGSALACLSAVVAVSLLPGASGQPAAVAAGGNDHAVAAQVGVQSLPPEVRAIMDHPLYRYARWSIYVADLATGAPLYDHQARELVVPGSVTKLFAGAAALDA